MEFTNEFSVPTDVDTTFATLTDLERVAPCLPGAQLEEVDGDVYTGRVKVKVGPISMTYRGQARMVEADAEAKRARIEASGKEARGGGTAKADVVATLREGGEGTLVLVTTDLTVTGKPAQFGRGVMEEVGTKIIDSFAERLRLMLQEEQGATEAAATSASTEPAPGRGEAAATGAASVGAAAAPAPAADGGTRRLDQDPSREDDALDLFDVAGGATLKRALPLVGVLAALAAVWLLLRRKRD
ncbi:SRPBCC family protein [Egicoccus sp. AB-alg6-2]|uniref:SRPBCC family protein n=1 Tax=Egicoccus sp. AB-alg6-2 TaxID=3242692 RepID=UPI00359DA4EF